MVLRGISPLDPRQSTLAVFSVNRIVRMASATPCLKRIKWTKNLMWVPLRLEDQASPVRLGRRGPIIAVPAPSRELDPHGCRSRSFGGQSTKNGCFDGLHDSNS